MVSKDVTVKTLFCEEGGCQNNIGYAGALVRNPVTEQRRILCLECRKKLGYKRWATEMEWK